MSDRRRNLFVLLTVVGLLAASLAVIFTKPTKLGLDFDGGQDHVGVVLEWGVRQLGKDVVVNAEGDIPAKAVADLFPAYDDDGGLLLILTPSK